jgi:hypothetical protein
VDFLKERKGKAEVVLTAYLASLYLTPDNNLSENAIRPLLNGLVPSRYLTHIFELAPLASSLADWEALLPWNLKC